MNELSTTELERMREHQEETMFDTCILLEYMPGAVDEFNVPKDNWQEGDELSCGFRTVKNREAMRDSEVVLIDAELRIPFDTEIDRRDRIRLTERFGEHIPYADRLEFEIVGEPVHGHTALVLQLVLVTEE